MQAVPASALSALADPPARLVDGAAMDYLLIETVNALRVSSAVASARARKIERDMVEAGLVPLPPPPAKQQNPRDSASSASGKISGPADEDEEVRSRLEAIGIHVGGNFAERYGVSKAMLLILIAPKALPRSPIVQRLSGCYQVCLQGSLGLVLGQTSRQSAYESQSKQLVHDFRNLALKYPQGVYVLQDHAFKPIARISSWEGRQEALKRAKLVC
jgi:hypothetical protein